MRGLGVLAASCCPSDVQDATWAMDTADAVLRHHGGHLIRARMDELGLLWKHASPSAGVGMRDGGGDGTGREVTRIVPDTMLASAVGRRMTRQRQGGKKYTRACRRRNLYKVTY